MRFTREEIIKAVDNWLIPHVRMMVDQDKQLRSRLEKEFHCIYEIGHGNAIKGRYNEHIELKLDILGKILRDESVDNYLD